MQKLRDIEAGDVRVIPPAAAVQGAAEAMRQLGVDSLPVGDGSKRLGMPTQRDSAVRSQHG